MLQQIYCRFMVGEQNLHKPWKKLDELKRMPLSRKVQRQKNYFLATHPMLGDSTIIITCMSWHNSGRILEIQNKRRDFVLTIDKNIPTTAQGCRKYNITIPNPPSKIGIDLLKAMKNR